MDRHFQLAVQRFAGKREQDVQRGPGTAEGESSGAGFMIGFRYLRFRYSAQASTFYRRHAPLRTSGGLGDSRLAAFEETERSSMASVSA